MLAQDPVKQWRLWECDPMLFDCCLPHFGMLGFILERTLLWRRDRNGLIILRCRERWPHA